AELSVNPGAHSVGATAEGFESAERDVNCGEGVRAEIDLTLRAKPVAPVVEKKPPNRVPGAVVTAIGGAGLVVGGVFGGLAFSATSSAKSQCHNNLCPPSASND